MSNRSKYRKKNNDIKNNEIKSMRLNFQERSELKIQSRIDPLESLRGSTGLIPRRLRWGSSFEGMEVFPGGANKLYKDYGL